ncbi:hypothetical protein CDAR_593291 [Caerostris darwini]|uniref:Uncharacterized protein n=1 Tax=Caerostris darwini TaxID=1538125 RepID=A0AAV4RQA7_9ARAC|nr:hypothetical protein CDAR_593291 [Caerostris darwini]
MGHIMADLAHHIAGSCASYLFLCNNPDIAGRGVAFRDLNASPTQCKNFSTNWKRLDCITCQASYRAPLDKPNVITSSPFWANEYI